jgi:hypothetical protein
MQQPWQKRLSLRRIHQADSVVLSRALIMLCNLCHTGKAKPPDQSGRLLRPGGRQLQQLQAEQGSSVSGAALEHTGRRLMAGDFLVLDRQGARRLGSLFLLLLLLDLFFAFRRAAFDLACKFASWISHGVSLLLYPELYTISPLRRLPLNVRFREYPEFRVTKRLLRCLTEGREPSKRKREEGQNFLSSGAYI